MKKLSPILLVLIIIGLSACSDDTPMKPLPQITWEVASGRFQVLTGEALTLMPTVTHTDETTTYTWQTEQGETVGHASTYTFSSNQEGTYYLTLCVTNQAGATTDEIRISVVRPQEESKPYLPAADSSLSAWRFPEVASHIALGRTMLVKAYFTLPDSMATYTWTLDGKEVDGLPGQTAYPFEAKEQGIHQLTLTALTDTLTLSHTFTIEVCPPAGTYRRPATGNSQAMVDRVYAYMPAPGHQVNGYSVVGRAFPTPCTHEQACDTVWQHFQRRWMVSLGACGGYLIAGFDHSVENSGGYDLCIKGNPFNYQSEPGIIWVSQDENGDGLPNDTWYELAGSEQGTDNREPHYAITYYRPQHPQCATAWRDHHGDTGEVPYMSYWNREPYYWQEWVEGTEHTFFGTRLASHHSYEEGASQMPPYGWGYADNMGSDLYDSPIGQAGRYKISQARTWDGSPIRLDYIDFVKIQTAQTGWTPNLGEISTEVYYIGDIHLNMP